MKKNTNNLKRMGIKSIHYKGHNVLFENVFDKSDKKSYVVYKDIDRLIGLDEVHIDNPDFFDFKNKSGFQLSSANIKLDSIVTNVKKESFIQHIIGITTDNNIDIQVFNNLEDIRRIIAFYINHVIYAINSVSKDSTSQINESDFDDVGIIYTRISYDDYYRNDPKKRNKMRNVILPLMHDALKTIYGYKLDISISYVDILKYIAKKDYSLTDKEKDNIKYKLDSSIQKIVDKNIKNHFIDFKNLYNQEYEETTLSDSRKLKLYKFNFDSNNGNLKKKECLNKKLSAKKAFDRITDQIKNETYEKVFEKLRLISIVRQFAVHGYDIQYYNDDKLSESTTSDLNDFSRDFRKTNKKYLDLLNDIKTAFIGDSSIDYDIHKEFYEFQIYDKGKNVPVSIEKIVKNMLNPNLDMVDQYYKENYEIITSTNDSKKKILSQEFNCKYKQIMKFYLYVNYNRLLSEYENTLRECQTNEKEETYINISNKILNDTKEDRKKISESVFNYLGEYSTQANYDNVDFNYPIQIKSSELSLIYSFSKLLTIKESNDMFSQLISKLESIGDLLRLKQKYSDSNIKNDYLNNDIFKRYQFIFDGTQEKNQESIDDLRILRSIRIKNKPQKEDCKEYERLIRTFKTDPDDFRNLSEDLSKTKDLNNKKSEKPLKQFLRNDVYLSKQYQYISKYSNMSICPIIMEHKEIISFVISNLIKSDSNLIKYISRVYFDYKQVTKNDTYIEDNEINELCEAIHSLNYKNINNSIFNKTTNNYKALVSLYLNICYLVVKNLVNINTLYFIEMQEYELLYQKIKKKNCAIFDLTIDKSYLINNQFKNNKSIIQIRELLENTDNDYYLNKIYQNKEKKELKKDVEILIKQFRNSVEHLSCFVNPNNWTFIKEEKIHSYFELYHCLMQQNIKEFINIVNTNIYSNNDILKNKDDRQYSQKVIILLNLPFLYNVSRFNNVTIEKYMVKKNQNVITNNK